MRPCLLRRRVLFALLTVLAAAAVRAGQVEVPVVGDVSPGASAGAVGSSLGALAPLSMTVSPSIGAPSFAAPLTGAPMAVLPAASARPASAAPLPSLPKSPLGPRAAAAVPGGPDARLKAGAVDAAEAGRDAAPAAAGAPETEADVGRVLFDRSGVAKPAGFDLGPGKTIVPDLLPAEVYSPRIMDAAREHGLVFDATPATLKRMKPGARYNYVIAENPDGTVAMTVGRMDPRNAKETAVKHVALAEGRPVLFSGVIRIDGAAGRPVLDFNSGSYSGVGLDPRWDPTPENARALSAYAQALLGTPVDILDHFQNRLIDLRGPGPLRSIVRRGASRGEGWEVDGRPVKRLSAGGFKEVLLHPSDPNVVIKLFSVTNAGDSVGSLSEKRLEMRNLAPLLAIGRAPRVVEQGGVVLETPATKGKMNAGYIVQERVVGRELGEMLKDPDPAVRARAAAEARALFDDLVAARLKLEDEVNMHENISIGRAGGGGPVKAWVLDAGEVTVVAKQSLVDRALGRPDPLRAYYDRVLSALLRR